MLRRSATAACASTDHRCLFHEPDVNWGNRTLEVRYSIYARDASIVTRVRGDLAAWSDGTFEQVAVENTHRFKVSGSNELIFEPPHLFVRIRSETRRYTVAGLPLTAASPDVETFIFHLDAGGFFVIERTYLEVPAYPCNFVSQVFFAARFSSMEYEPTLTAYVFSQGRMITFTGDMDSGRRQVHVRYSDMVSESPFAEVEVEKDAVTLDWPGGPIRMDTTQTTAEDAYSCVYRGFSEGLEYVVVRRKPKDYLLIRDATGVWVSPRVPTGLGVAGVALIAAPLALFAAAVAALMAFIWRRTRRPREPA